GRLVKNTGDGILATFDGPARAIRCAQAIATGVKSLGIEVRAGLHTGEVELRGEDVTGMGVSIAARVMDTAAPGAVVVSSTAADRVSLGAVEGELERRITSAPTAPRGSTRGSRVGSRTLRLAASGRPCR